MRELLKDARDFKIIPGNFKSSGELDIISINDDEIIANIKLLDSNELSDYIIGSRVEIFGVNQLGLIYFETKILSKDGCKLSFSMTQDYSIIQRREYSRVKLSQGEVVFKDSIPDLILKIEDISAGGIKLITSQPLEIDRYYDIEVKLSNNMKIECSLAPIRIKECQFDDKRAFSISGKFVNLENADRIVLVQYAFKIKMEEQNKEDK